MPLNSSHALAEMKPEVTHGKTSPRRLRVPLAIVAAIGENGVIGDGRGMPWHLPSDLKHFRAITLGKPLLVGRKTFESIGRVLPGRETIVVTRNANFDPANEGKAQHVHIAHGLEEALDLAQSLAQVTGAEEIILAGGGNLYENLISRAERMHLTFVDLAPSGSVCFPRIDWSGWLEVSRIRPRPSAKDEATFAFVDFDRRHCLSM
ncbi:MAG TPA: dihydrofolate reductase [Methylocella sp.]|nr:dihydrofolate reductase [Methylocella sp.]